MRPIVFTTLTGNTSAWIPLDRNAVPFSVSLSGKVASGAPTYSIEKTFDNVLDPAVTPTAIADSTMTAKTAAAETSYTTPVAAVRCVVTGTGGATITILQGLPL